MALFVAVAFCATTLVVEATYSIVAADLATRQVGGSGATCLPGQSVFDALYVSEPNRSVLHTQGWLIPHDSPIVLNVRELMKNETPPDEILEAMLEQDVGFFRALDVFGIPGFGSIPEANVRQWGLADFEASAGYTGDQLDFVYEEILGILGTIQQDKGGVHNRFQYHAQSNIVVNGTNERMQEGFESPPVGFCDDLPGRLMAGLYVGGSLGGDVRCDPVSASGAFLHVDNPDGTEYLHIEIVGDGSVEPLDELAGSYFKWREQNPCPTDATDAPTTATPATNNPVPTTGAPSSSLAPTYPPINDAITPELPTDDPPTTVPLVPSPPKSGGASISAFLISGLVVMATACF
jgi:hypothetical protein